ncbi:hypothetical protein LTR15_000500 [Elasticomyces elasticus]|nr:hypothetical protein LTR15_000500 [Elasticomyces elasticus]
MSSTQEGTNNMERMIFNKSMTDKELLSLKDVYERITNPTTISQEAYRQLMQQIRAADQRAKAYKPKYLKKKCCLWRLEVVGTVDEVDLPLLSVRAHEYLMRQITIVSRPNRTTTKAEPLHKRKAVWRKMNGVWVDVMVTGEVV